MKRGWETGLYATAPILDSTGLKYLSKSRESSRPRELPPQSLTDPDVNLPIHPAPIDQPTVPQIASEQTYEASVLQCAEEGKTPCVCDRATFCISDTPIAAMRG